MKHVKTLSNRRPVAAMMGTGKGMMKGGSGMWQWMDEDMWAWMEEQMAGKGGINT